MHQTVAYKAGYLAAKNGRSLDESISRFQVGTKIYDDYKAGYESYKEENK
ncbi:hypothetical protein NTE19_003400 [Vibrio fluvialis]|nr:hypothetical protein [Vibrio fluvialis]